MIDATERKITLFGIDQALQVTVTDGPNDWRAPIVQYLRGERHGSLRGGQNGSKGSILLFDLRYSL